MKYLIAHNNKRKEKCAIPYDDLQEDGYIRAYEAFFSIGPGSRESGWVIEGAGKVKEDE